MSVFGALQSVNEVSLDDVQVTECKYEPDLAGASMLVYENEENWSRMMKHIGITELNYFAENGEVMVYEAGTLGSFFENIKKFFVKMWEKIKSLFQKFIALIDSFIRSDKDFVSKYKGTLLKVVTRDFSYKGYKFTTDKWNANDALAAGRKYVEDYGLDANMVGPKAANAMEDVIKKHDGNTSDFEDGLRGKIAGESNSLDSAEFTAELFKKLRDGEDSPIEIDTVNVTDLLSTIDGYAKGKQAAEKDHNASEKAIKEVIKGLEKNERDMTKLVPNGNENDTAEIKAQRATSIKFVSKTYSALKEVINMTTTANGIKLQALKSENRQAKAVCVALIGYKPKNESVDYESSFAGEINFI